VSAGAYSGIKDGISYSGPFQGEGIFHYPTDRCSDLAPQTLEVGALVGFSGKSIDSSNRLELSSSSLSIVSDDSFQSGTVRGSYGYSKSGENEAVFNYDFSYAEEGYAETERGIVRLIFTELTGGVFSSAGNYEGIIGDDSFSGGFDGWGLFTYSPASGSLQLISAP
jgi:hypothetical protein